MKSLLIIASFVALALTSPVDRDNIVAEPDTIDIKPVAIGPGIVPQTNADGPAVVEPTPISVGPVIVESPIELGAVQVIQKSMDDHGTPLIQVILNVNGVSQVINGPIHLGTGEPIHVAKDVAEPVQAVDVASEPASPVAEVAPEPVAVGVN